MPGPVTMHDVRHGASELGLNGLPLCVHSSLRSFGRVEGGAGAVVEGLLAEECTVVVPTFSSPGFLVPPPEQMRPDRNGWNYDDPPVATEGLGRIYSTDTNDVNASMGAVPAAVLSRPGRVRGSHPLSSFAAVGPLAERIVGAQRPLDVFAPLRILAAKDGWVVLMGVGLDSLTLLHLAEEKSGRKLFRRWANGPDGKPMEVEVGGCSSGFEALAPILAPLQREVRVGSSSWRAYPAREAAAAAAEAILANPRITHCGRRECRCDDAVAGGPSFARD